MGRLTLLYPQQIKLTHCLAFLFALLDLACFLLIFNIYRSGGSRISQTLGTIPKRGGVILSSGPFLPQQSFDNR